MDYLLSIVVPVKNDYEHLKAIIKKVNTLNSNIIELVIQDNTKVNEGFLKILEENKFNNLTYNHTKGNLTMSENFEMAINISSGEYLCILGADDNISAKILDATKYLKSKKIESAVFNKALFNWPGMTFKTKFDKPSLTIFKSSGKLFNINVQKELDSLLKGGMVSLGKLPEPYHGIIKKSVLNRVLKETGKYVPAACPDMAMAVALSFLVQEHVYIDAPVTISGHSHSSNAGRGARGMHKGDLKDKSFLPDNIEDTWPPFIPKIWTGPTMYADSVYNTLIALGKENKLKLFNKEASYANIISIFPEYYRIIKPYIKDNYISKVLTYIFIIKIFFKRLFLYANNWKTSKLKLTTNKIYFKVNNSYDASVLVDRYITENIQKIPSN